MTRNVHAEDHEIGALVCSAITLVLREGTRATAFVFFVILVT